MELQNARTISELTENCEIELRALKRMNFGVTYLDDSLLGLFPGEVTLIGARSGAGKTELASQILLEQMHNHRSPKILYFAIDHEDGEIEMRLLWRLLIDALKAKKPDLFNQNHFRYVAWRAGEYVGMFDEIQRDIQLYVKHMLALQDVKFFYHRGCTSDEISDAIRGELYASEYSLIILDHFHAMRFEGDVLKAQSRAIHRIAEGAKRNKNSVIVFGQFRKRSPTNKSPIPDMEEFSGSSDLSYVPHNIVVFGRKHTDNANHGETYFHTVKARLASDAKPFVGVHSFDAVSKKYSQKYEIMMHVPYSEPKEIEGKNVPKWAKNAQRQIQNFKGFSWQQRKEMD